jgi:predicted Zn-dependent peptidase
MAAHAFPLAAMTLVLLIAAPGLASDYFPDEPDDTTGPSIPLETRTLECGLRLVVLPQPGARLVSVETFHRAGALSEPDSLEGLAHFAEHLLTHSAGNMAGGELARRLALYTTRHEASTGPAAMRFTSQCLPEFLPEILAVEAQRMRGAALDSLTIERERQVILEELAFRARLTPHDRFLQHLMRSSYPDHPLGRDIGGSHDSVRRIGGGDIEAFVARRIRAPGAVMVISGAVGDLDVGEIAGQAFDFLPPAPPAAVQPIPYPVRAARQWVGDASDFQGVKVGVAFRIPIQDHRNAVMAAALMEFLRDLQVSVSSRSVPGEALVLLHGTWIYYRPERDPDSDYYIGGAVFNAEQDSRWALERIWRVLGDRIGDFSSQKEFERLREEILAGLRGPALDPGLGVSIGRTLIAGDVPVLPDSLACAIENLTGIELQEFAASYLTPGNATVGVCHGSDSGRGARIELAGRAPEVCRFDAPDPLGQLGHDAITPVLEAYGRTDLFDLELINLPSGLPLLHLETGAAGQWCLAGMKTFPPLKDLRAGQKPGLEHLYNSVVDYGETEEDPRTGTRTPRKLPYDLGFHLRPDHLTYRVEGPPEEAAEMARTLVARLLDRDFNTTRWSRVLDIAAESLARRHRTPDNAARSWRLQQMLGPGSSIPMHWSPDPSVARSLRYNDLRKLHGKVARDLVSTTLVSVGTMSAKEAAEIVEAEFAALGEYRTKHPKKPKTPEIPPRHGRVFPDLESGDVRITVLCGLQPLPRDSQTFGLACLYFEELLRARLNSRLRQKTGLTYHVGCRAEVHGGALLWEIQTTAQPGQAPALLAELEAVLEQIHTEYFTPDECSRAKLALVGDAISRLSDVDSAANWLLRLARFGPVPDDPEAALHALSPADVQASPGKAFTTEPRVFTIVGPMFREDIDQFQL